MIRVQYRNDQGAHCTRYFTTSSEAGLHLEKMRRPAVILDECDEILGECREIPQDERNGNAQWTWWYDPTRCSVTGDH